MTETLTSWQQEAEALGISVLANIARLQIDAILEVFGPQWGAPPLFIYEGSATPTQDELREIADKTQRLISEKKAAHVVKKLTDGTWTYRRLSWNQGPTWFPTPGPLHEILAKI